LSGAPEPWYCSSAVAATAAAAVVAYVNASNCVLQQAVQLLQCCSAMQRRRVQ
jgi:hypothetical protein